MAKLPAIDIAIEREKNRIHIYEINFQYGRNKSTKAMHRSNSIDVLEIDMLQKSQNFKLPLTQ